MNVWDFLKSIFQEAEESSPSKPLLHEAIERDEVERQTYLAWRESPDRQRAVDWIAHQYGLWKALPDEIDDAILFLDTPSSKGFALHFVHPVVEQRHAAHLFDFLKEKTLALNYRPQVADTRTWSNKSAVQTMDRYYLKPRTSRTEEGKINQLFGNVTIELSHRDNVPFNLKFRATAYNDRLYLPAEDFGVLMDGLFG